MMLKTSSYLKLYFFFLNNITVFFNQINAALKKYIYIYINIEKSYQP